MGKMTLPSALLAMAVWGPWTACGDAGARIVSVSAGSDLLAVRDRVRAERRPDERVRVVLDDGVYTVTNRSCHIGLHLDARGMCWPGYKNNPVEPVDNAFVDNALVDLNGYGFDLSMPSKYTLPTNRFTCRGNVAFMTRGAVFGHKLNPCLGERQGIRCVIGSEQAPLDLGFVDLPEPLCDYSLCAKGFGTNWGKVIEGQVNGFGDKPFKKGDFTLKPNARLLKEMPTFKPIPFAKIGPRRRK